MAASASAPFPFMSKNQDSKKQTKKVPLRTKAEKKAAKQAKKGR